MKEHYEDDRCIIPEEIKKMSNEELQKKIAQFEQVGKTHKTCASTVSSDPCNTTLSFGIIQYEWLPFHGIAIFYLK